MTVNGPIQGGGRKQFLAIVAIAVLPFVAASVLYRFVQGGEGWGSVNHGALLEPAVHVDALLLQPLGGKPLQAGKWWLLFAQPGRCDEVCEVARHNFEQMPTLVGRESARVQIATLLDEGQDVQSAHVDGTLYRAALPATLRECVFIVDPHGNIVMWYRFEQIDKPFLEDLRLLLKHSVIG